MDSYRASKVWHIGQELAREVQAIAQKLPEESDLRGYLRVTSASIPLKVALSVNKSLQREKLQCYTEAREAAVQLQKHLMLAKSTHYMEKVHVDTLLAKTIEAEQLLNVLIRKTTQAVAAAK